MPSSVHHGSTLTCKYHKSLLHFSPRLVVHRSTQKPRSILSQASQSSRFLNRCNVWLTVPERVNAAPSPESGVCCWDLMSPWCLEKRTSWEERSRGQLSVIQKEQVRTDLTSLVSALPYGFITPAPGWEKAVESSDGREIRTRVSISLPGSSDENLGWQLLSGY